METTLKTYTENTLPIGFCSEYISDIPWDNNPAFMFVDHPEQYITAFKNVIDLVPIGDMKIKFDDDTWDFNPYFEDVNSTYYIFHFDKMPDEIVDYCKFWIISLLGRGKKPSTIRTRFSWFRDLYTSVKSKGVHTTIYTINTADYEEEISSRNPAIETEHNMLQAIIQFYDFLKKNYKIEAPIDIKKLSLKSAKLSNLSKTTDENKLPNIPEEYFQAIRKTCTEIMRDKKSPYTEKWTASVAIMLGELGLRINDLLSLTTDRLMRKKLLKSGHEVNYIRYKSKKPTKLSQPLLEFDIFATDLCVEAFNTLKTLKKDIPYINNNYLMVLPTEKYKGNYPISATKFIGYFEDLLCKYLPEYSFKDWNGTIEPKKYKHDKIIYVPDTRQFRVHLCSFLYNEKHVSLTWIQRYMGHLSDQMLGYYVRPKDKFQENYKYSEQIIKEIAKDKLKPLGGDGAGEEIAKRVIDFIEKENFNVETDIETIVKKFEDQVIIRGKTGGVCIKTSLMPCARDARSNEIFCAYNMCPNLFHFYYMIDVSYTNFKTLQKSYETNLKNGYERAADKELQKLKSIVRNRLIPELNELKREIDKKGFDAVVQQYPSIMEIAANTNSIEEEIEIWLKK